MSVTDQWTVIGRAKLDGDFAGQLLSDFDGAVAQSGYRLNAGELETARQAIAGELQSSAAGPLPDMTDWRFQQEKMRERVSAQVARMNELGAYTVQILKDTLGNAAFTYRMITWMNTAMFLTGISLFMMAAIYAAIANEKVYSLVFAGMGAATFVTIFLVSPIERTQTALSNLVQVEIAFMNYFEQLTFWETFALTPRPNSAGADPASIERASALLQERSHETIELLQVYIEPDGKRAVRKLKRDKKNGAANVE